MPRRARLPATALLLGALLASAPPGAAQPLPFDTVVAQLSAADPSDRREAVRLLAASGLVEAVEPVARLLADPDDRVQQAAIEAELRLLVVDPRSAAPAAAFAAAPIGIKPVPIPPALAGGLSAALNDDSADVRWASLYAVGALLPPPADPSLVEAVAARLADPSPAIRIAALDVLGRLRASAAADRVIGLVNDEDDAVRRAAMRALGALRARTAVQALTEQFEFYGRGELGEAALEALARIGDPASLPVFVYHLEDRRAAWRRFAAEGAGRTGAGQMVDALEQRLGQERDPVVRLAMAFGLARLGRPYLERLVEALADGRLAELATGYLVELGSPAAPGLAAYLQHPSPAVRGQIADVLGVIGGADVEVALGRLSNDPHADVAAAATRAIARIRLRSGAAQ